jgi:chaperonin GroES
MKENEEVAEAGESDVPPELVEEVEELTQREEAVEAVFGRVPDEVHYDFEPAGGRVAVRPLTEGELRRGSLVIPAVAKERPQYGHVIAVGRGAPSPSSGLIPLPVRFAAGDLVAFHRHAGTDLDLNGETIIVLAVQDVLGVLMPL